MLVASESLMAGDPDVQPHLPCPLEGAVIQLVLGFHEPKKSVCRTWLAQCYHEDLVDSNCLLVLTTKWIPTLH